MHINWYSVVISASGYNRALVNGVRESNLGLASRVEITDFIEKNGSAFGSAKTPEKYRLPRYDAR